MSCCWSPPFYPVTAEPVNRSTPLCALALLIVGRVLVRQPVGRSSKAGILAERAEPGESAAEATPSKVLADRRLFALGAPGGHG